ncbi:Fur family transcriptional regulator [Flagellimonas sp.]|uniref:Fur family transcriptional regulator n=1 Tax=Flagellimonas sp. TaxID=2058762 RepID=UPI003F4A5040
MGIIRKTKSVKLLLEEITQNKTAISTRELVERLQLKMNKSTVYRILERLEDDGLLHSFTGQDGLTWYAINNDSGNSHSDNLTTHPHFQCRDCGKTECLPIDVSVPEVAEHSIESVSLLLVGKCADCIR